MVTYEDALEFRELADLTLNWDGEVLPPPRDRVEFTRLIIEAAEVAGLTTLVGGTPTIWASERIRNDDPEKKWEVFQNAIHQYTYRQSLQGIPKVAWYDWTEEDIRRTGVRILEWDQYVQGAEDDFCIPWGTYPFAGVRILKWGEYIQRLEDDYFKPWKTSWLFGISEDSEERVLRQLMQGLASCRKESSQTLKYPDVETLSGSEIVARYLSVEDGEDFSRYIRQEMDVDLPLVKMRYSGFLGEILLFTPFVVGLLCFLGLIFGSIEKLYSGWLLFLFIPVVLIATLFATVVVNITKSTHLCWSNKTMTFRALAKQIVMIKKREWEILQFKYGLF